MPGRRRGAVGGVPVVAGLRLLRLLRVELGLLVGLVLRLWVGLLDRLLARLLAGLLLVKLGLLVRLVLRAELALLIGLLLRRLKLCLLLDMRRSLLRLKLSVRPKLRLDLSLPLPLRLSLLLPFIRIPRRPRLSRRISGVGKIALVSRPATRRDRACRQPCRAGSAKGRFLGGGRLRGRPRRRLGRVRYRTHSVRLRARLRPVHRPGPIAGHA